jgi:hypothetical protein
MRDHGIPDGEVRAAARRHGACDVDARNQRIAARDTTAGCHRQPVLEVDRRVLDRDRDVAVGQCGVVEEFLSEQDTVFGILVRDQRVYLSHKWNPS